MDGTSDSVSSFESDAFGAALILLGIAATGAGMWEHRHVLASIKDPEYRYADRPATARWMGIGPVIVGLIALAVILVK